MCIGFLAVLNLKTIRESHLFLIREYTELILTVALDS